MPFTDKIVYGNSGVGTAGGATSSTAPALPTFPSDAHISLLNGTGTDAIPGNDKLLFGTKFTFDSATGKTNMFFVPARHTERILGEYSYISSASSTELYVEIVNYTSVSKNLTASDKLLDGIVLRHRNPLKIIST